MKTKKLLSNCMLFLLIGSMLAACPSCSNHNNSNNNHHPNSSPASSTQSSVSSKQLSLDPNNSKENSDLDGAEYQKLINDDGIFSANYQKAYDRMKKMSLNEKIGQMLYAHCPISNGVETARKYHLGGYVLFGDNFADKTKEDVIVEMKSYVNSQDIPMTLSVDEEGGEVTRISGKAALIDHEFLSPRELYNEGGMEQIRFDADEKSKFLKQLWIDTNLAPVCDISTDENDFMYSRSIGLSPQDTAEFVKTVTEISQKNGVSVALKHFPGYGSNLDTHTGIAIDDRDYAEFENSEFIPFKAGIDAGAHLVLVSHNIVNCMDSKMPASISPQVHTILREKLGFTGIIITDDLIMDAVTEYSGEYPPVVNGVLAGNDMLIVGDAETAFNDIQSAVENKVIDEKQIDTAVLRILAWKYTTGLMK